jgi:organic hydroperoxide reductase OsmC/OhrA
MSTYTAELIWERGEQDFLNNHYSRRHQIRFDGGVTLAGSSSPQVVPLPWSDTNAVDPEEAFVASLSSCHMLWFLALAAKRGFCVDRYLDQASGVLGRTAERKMAMTVVTLKPAVHFSGAKLPTPTDIAQLHHEAHDQCYIANSVKTEVRVEPVLTDT